MKLIIYFISFFSFISSLAQGNNGQILKTIPDTVRVNDTFKLVKVTQSSVFESSNCFFLRNKTDTSFLDTLKTNLFFEYPQLQFGGLCIRYDTFKLILNTLGTKYIISEWLMRDTVLNLPYSSIGRDTLVLQVYGATNLKENEGEATVQLYPNPVQNRLHLKGNWKSLESIIIRDVKGKVLYQEVPQASLDLTKLSSGIYFLQLTSQGKSWTEKFVKQ